MRLNKNQQKAVEFKDGVMFVIAGAGSGKSKIVVQRVANLIDTHFVDPSEILVITFTRKAAQELKDRLESIIGSRSSLLNVGTMHSIFLKILRQEGKQYLKDIWPFELITKDFERKKIVEQSLILKGMSLNIYNPWDALKKISLIKNLGKDYLNSSPKWIKDVYFDYEQVLKKKRLIDFDSILILTKNIFEKYPQVLKRYQELFKYILVDEYQDTNPVQSRIINLLVKGNKNLFVVGDIEQSIYGFRGTTPEIMINYKKTYPEAELVKLDTNYRSKIQILDKANSLISHSKNPLTLKLVTDKIGGNVQLLKGCLNADEEATVVSDLILKKLQTNGSKPKDFAVLYRTNQQSRALEEHFVRNAVPYRIVGSDGFYHRSEIKDMLAYLWIIENPDRASNAIERIYCRPNRWLGKVWLNEYYEKLDNYNDLEALNISYSRSSSTNGAKKLYRQLRKLINERKNITNPGELIKLIREVTEYDQWLVKQYPEQEDNNRIDNLNEFTNTSSRFTDSNKLFNYIEILKQKVAEDNELEDKVSLLTIHRAKGLEWPIVFITGVVQGLLPHNRGNLEEERRVMYVASTRAMEELYLSYYTTLFNYPAAPSVFIKDMGIPCNLKRQENEC